MRRLTVREFRATLSRVDEPVLVGDGVWFPRVTSELIRIAEGRNVPLALPKAAQARGHLRK